MTTMNMMLYRLLLKTGATEAEAEAAATLDATQVATKADVVELRAAISDSKLSILMWVIVIELAQTTLLVTLLYRLVGGAS